MVRHHIEPTGRTGHFRDTGGIDRQTLRSRGEAIRRRVGRAAQKIITAVTGVLHTEAAHINVLAIGIGEK